MDRQRYLHQINFQFKIHSVCGLLGARQVGKTTLSKRYAQGYEKVHFFDLEDSFDLARLENPLLALRNLNASNPSKSGTAPNLIVIDEIQRRPDLFPVLRVLVDEKPHRILILGSASRDLLQQSSETLAGRIGYIELPPFSVQEVPDHKMLWARGGFPQSYLANSDLESYAWRQSYITTFLERDIPMLGFHIPPLHIRRLWMMLAHYHGQILNNSEIGKSLTISNHTVRNYIEILSGTFMVRVLQPWFENISKRQVKSPKIYIRDSGLLHALLGIQDYDHLLVFPKLGSSWEGFALEEIIKQYQATPEECYFWATQSGAELDLLIIKDGKRIGFEFKHTDYPKITASMRIALDTLHLDHLYVITPNEKSFLMDDKITARGLTE